MDKAFIRMSGVVSTGILDGKGGNKFFDVLACIPPENAEFRVRWAVQDQIPPFQPGDMVFIDTGQIYQSKDDKKTGVNIADRLQQTLMMCPQLDRPSEKAPVLTITGDVTAVTPAATDGIEFVTVRSQVPGGSKTFKVRKPTGKKVNVGDKAYATGKAYIPKTGEDFGISVGKEDFFFTYPVNDGTITPEELKK